MNEMHNGMFNESLEYNGITGILDPDFDDIEDQEFPLPEIQEKERDDDESQVDRSSTPKESRFPRRNPPS